MPPYLGVGGTQCSVPPPKFLSNLRRFTRLFPIEVAELKAKKFLLASLAIKFYFYNDHRRRSWQDRGHMTPISESGGSHNVQCPQVNSDRSHRVESKNFFARFALFIMIQILTISL